MRFGVAHVGNHASLWKFCIIAHAKQDQSVMHEHVSALVAHETAFLRNKLLLPARRAGKRDVVSSAKVWAFDLDVMSQAEKQTLSISILS